MNIPDQLLLAIAPWLLGLAGLATAVAAFITLRQALGVRRTSLFILRRRWRRQLRASLGMTALFAALTAALFLALRSWPDPVGETRMVDVAPQYSPSPVRAIDSAPFPPAAVPLPTPTPSLARVQGSSPTVPFIPTNTPTHTPSATLTPTLTPSNTPTPSPTSTPSPTVPVLEAIRTPVTPFATPPAEAQLGPLTVSARIQPNGTPIDAGTEFLEGQPALHVSFDYDGMANGVLWRYIWFRDGAVFAGGTRVWDWLRRGRTYISLMPTGGFPPGQFEVQLLLAEDVVQTASFTVLAR